MKKINKIVLSIPLILVFIYMVILWFPVELHWVTPTMKAYYAQVAIIQGLTVIQLVVLVKKLWSFKNVEKSKKLNGLGFLFYLAQLEA